MKTLLTIGAGCLFSIAAMAADRRPSVTIKSKRNFEIIVDGQRYHNDNTIRLRGMNRGIHTIKVYERSRGFFGNRLRLVSSKNFLVRNNDLTIMIDHFGRIDIDEQRNGRGWDRGWNDNNRDHDWKDNDRYNDRDRRY
ncbi:MAG: hypothetical protein EPN92_09910 [Chitinophagaceae bacterium]|nr:MAG: hypothetical protein EPN92_09910 [Chitinophagaceae bacterium]